MKRMSRNNIDNEVSGIIAGIISAAEKAEIIKAENYPAAYGNDFEGEEVEYSIRISLRKDSRRLLREFSLLPAKLLRKLRELPLLMRRLRHNCPVKALLYRCCNKKAVRCTVRLTFEDGREIFATVRQVRHCESNK